MSFGNTVRSHFIITASGPLHKPKLPGAPGIESFESYSFYASRWDYDYTGRDVNGGLTKLADKRVGITGTGATEVQAVSHLNASAKQLYVSPMHPFKKRMDNFSILVSGVHQDKNLVDDSWTDILRNSVAESNSNQNAASMEEMMKQRQLADFRKMEKAGVRLDQLARDPPAAAKLKRML